MATVFSKVHHFKTYTTASPTVIFSTAFFSAADCDSCCHRPCDTDGVECGPCCPGVRTHLTVEGVKRRGRHPLGQDATGQDGRGAMMMMMLMMLMPLLLLIAESWSGRLWSAPEAADARSCHCSRKPLTRTAGPREEPLIGYQDGRPLSIHTRWQSFVGRRISWSRPSRGLDLLPALT